ARAVAMRRTNRRTAGDRQPHGQCARHAVAAAAGEPVDEPETFATRGTASSRHAMRFAAHSSENLGGAGVEDGTFRGRIRNVDGFSCGGATGGGCSKSSATRTLREAPS